MQRIKGCGECSIIYLLGCCVCTYSTRKGRVRRKEVSAVVSRLSKEKRWRQEEEGLPFTTSKHCLYDKYRLHSLGEDVYLICCAAWPACVVCLRSAHSEPLRRREVTPLYTHPSQLFFPPLLVHSLLITFHQVWGLAYCVG
jgi:hypothetical protein